MENYYLCNKCFGITKRDSNTKTIKSDCAETNKKAILSRINNADELAIKLRKEFLRNGVDLDDFKPKQRLFIEMAFEQGVKVTFNKLI